MNRNKKEASDARGDWDAYWRNAQSAAAHKEGGPQDEVLERFWRRLFDGAFPSFRDRLRVLDLGCGSGAVTRFALASSTAIPPGVTLEIAGLDESPAAVAELRKRHADVAGIAADAARLPVREAAFDVVASQFGIEYAGPGAVGEAARLVGNGGIFAAVLHMHGGGIYRECAINQEAIDGYRSSGLLDSFKIVFETASAVQQGRAEEAQFRQADQQFGKSVAAAEKVLARCGREVATGLLYRVYTDVAHMYKRLAAYEPDEIYAWVEVMSKEFDSYSGRMYSMLNAALDETGLQELMAQLESLGLNVRMKDSLRMGPRAVPSAWVVVADRP